MAHVAVELSVVTDRGTVGLSKPWSTGIVIPAATVGVPWSVCLLVCLSRLTTARRAKAAEPIVMPFGM